MPAPNLLLPGDPVPWFKAAALSGSPAYEFSSVAGRHILMLFYASAAMAPSQAALAVVAENRALFDDHSACFFGICTDKRDAEGGRIAQSIPGIRFFLDYDHSVSTLYGAASDGQYHPHWLLLDPGLRVLRRFPLPAGAEAIACLRDIVDAGPQEGAAPALIVPNVFEPDFCRDLIALYEADGGKDSGFMRDVEGKTVLMVDPSHKRRRDWEITDTDLRRRIVARLNRRLRPAIERAFQFTPTRIERYVVACYDESGGYFRPHRDNTTKGTAHRKFAVTMNLNAEDYEGGDLRFPEFGRRTYRAPTGGAVVFSCSLLHEARPVTKGRRYAFLPFLYDEEAAQVRLSNNPHLGEGVGAYTMGGGGDGSPEN